MIIITIDTNNYNYILGGCGAMFDINVIAPEFKGLNTIKQHRIINEVKSGKFFSKKITITLIELQLLSFYYKLFYLMYRYSKKKLKICMVFEYVQVSRNRKFSYRWF